MRPEMIANGKSRIEIGGAFEFALESHAARYKIYVSFISSAGWKLSGPSRSQRGSRSRRSERREHEDERRDADEQENECDIFEFIYGRNSRRKILRGRCKAELQWCSR